MKARFELHGKTLEGEVIRTGKVQRRHRGRLATGLVEAILVRVNDRWQTVYSLRGDRDDWTEVPS
jgi:hypothetical protein